MTCRIETHGNGIVVAGTFALSDARRFAAALHAVTSKLGYEDVTLDFARCTAAYPGPMVGLCSQVAAMRAKGFDFELIVPREPRIARIFVGANWACLIDPERHKRSTYRGYTHVPVICFSDQESLGASTNRIVDALLSSIPGIDRADLAAIEWSANEIADNVLVHSQSPVGGFASVNLFRASKRAEVCVADAGIGIPASLRQRFPEWDDISLLEAAIKEGVTRDPALGQGNGLFGTFQVARASEGYFHILSGYAALSYEKGQLRITRERIPYTGTLVVAGMDASNPAALGDALRFGEVRYAPTDYIELHYEDRAGEDVIFRMREETISCGSRIAGTPVRTKLGNLVQMNQGRRVIVDMTDIPLVSSSFADEVFGKLFVTLGPLRFIKAIEMRGTTPTVTALIDRAILQRSREE